MAVKMQNSFTQDRKTSEPKYRKKAPGKKKMKVEKITTNEIKQIKKGKYNVKCQQKKKKNHTLVKEERKRNQVTNNEKEKEKENKFMKKVRNRLLLKSEK